MCKLLKELGLKIAPDKKDKAFIRGASKQDIAYAKDEFGSKGKQLATLTGTYALSEDEGKALDKALEENLKNRNNKWLKNRNNYQALAKDIVDKILQNKIRNSILSMSDSHLQGVSAAKKLELLKILRTPNVDVEDPSKNLLPAVEKLYKNMSFTPKYDEKSKEVEDELVDQLKDKIKDAKKNWKKSGATEAEKKEILDEFLKIQCAAQKKATGVDVPVVEAELVDLPSSEWGNYASPPPRIQINKNKLNDFRGILDTIVHENTHNMQRALMKEKDSLTDPELKQQAEIFELNTNNGYVSSSDSSAYRDQPKERDAWGFAERVTDRLMPVPKVK